MEYCRIIDGSFDKDFAKELALLQDVARKQESFFTADEEELRFFAGALSFVKGKKPAKTILVGEPNLAILAAAIKSASPKTEVFIYSFDDHRAHVRGAVYASGANVDAVYYNNTYLYNDYDFAVYCHKVKKPLAVQVGRVYSEKYTLVRSQLEQGETFGDKDTVQLANKLKADKDGTYSLLFVKKTPCITGSAESTK